MKKLKLLLLAIIIVIGLTQCKKENETAPSPASTGSTSNISSFFTQNAVAKQIFTIDAGQYQSITGTKGTKVAFSPNSFKDAAGNTVTGSVRIELREIYSKADMIKSKAPTISGGQLLISGGEIFMQAFQGSQELSLASSNSVYVMMPTDNTNNGTSPYMQEFYSDSEFLGDSLDWDSSIDSSTVNVVVDSSGMGGGTYYYFPINSLNWINCDYFYASPGPFTSVFVNTSGSFNSTNTTVFLSFNGINAAAYLSQTTTNNQLFSAWYNLPIGMNVTIVAISEISGQYYSSFTPATLTSGFNPTITLNATTLAQINTDLSNLP